MPVAPAQIIDVFQRPVDRRIEEVVKVDQTNEDDLALELSEYVVTDSIREGFERLLEVYRETPNKPHEGIGIWISGFFGSGKSSFAKILGYVLEGRKVKGRDAADLFCERLGPRGDRIRALLSAIRAQIPTTAIIFDVSTNRGVRGSERITEMMYKALLRNLGYAVDVDLAELEIGLESDGRLEEFERRFEARYRQPWRVRRALIALAMNEASAIMHEIEPLTYPQADSWARVPRATDVTPNLLAERTFQLSRRRLGDRTIVYVVDEVGQYVSRSSDKLLDLNGVLHAMGTMGKGKAWVAVTSQEKLDEVVDSLEGVKIELARVQDRFPNRVDLAPSDISEVTSKRVLTKRPECEAPLRALYDGAKGTLASHARLDAKARRMDLDAASFVNLYPFLPYHIDLIIDVVSGMRNQPGASRQTGGANRTIIKLAQQALIHPRVDLGHRPVGDLVTLDAVYDLLEGGIHFERRKDVDDIAKAFAGDPLVAKVAKAICLLQLVNGIPRTAANVAAVLYPRVGAGSLARDVDAAIGRLVEAQKLREGESGYELLSVEGKNWEAERRGLAPRPVDEDRLLGEAMADALRDVKPYRYKNARNFAPALTINGRSEGKGGEIPFHVQLVEGGRDLDRAYDAARQQSRQEGVVWVVPVDAAAGGLVTDLCRSREMIARHERNLTSIEIGQLLSGEKNRQEKLQQQLRGALGRAALEGRCYADGREHEARSLGQDPSAVVAALFADVVPRRYDQFELGAVAVKGDEAKQLLTSLHLTGLPDVLYDRPGGLGLVVSQHGNAVVNAKAPIASAVASFIAERRSYGEPATGKGIEDHFDRPPFGWSFDVVVAVVAALLRAGAIEATSQGRTYKSWNDPAALAIFTATPRFRAASFAPREGVTVEALVNAGRLLSTLYGDDLGLDAGTLARAIRARLAEEIPALTGLKERLRANSLPGWQQVDEAIQTYQGIAASDDDDAVKAFGGEAERLRALRARLQRYQAAGSDANLATIAGARAALGRCWPALRERPNVPEGLGEAARRLDADLRSETWDERLTQIATDAGAIRAVYDPIAAGVLERYRADLDVALTTLREREDFAQLPPPTQAQIEEPFQARLEDASERDGPPDLARLEADHRLLPVLVTDAVVDIERLLRPEVPVRRIGAARFFPGAIASIDELDEALRAFRDHCAKLLAEQAKLIIE